MAIFNRESVFDNPYIDIGKHNDICSLCRSEYRKEYPGKSEYQIDEELNGQLLDKHIFKIFRNSNTPFVLCAKHIHDISAILQGASECNM